VGGEARPILRHAAPVEDAGAWTPVAYFSAAAYGSKEAALLAAVTSVAWFAE